MEQLTGREKQIVDERKKKISELRKSGINPFPNKFEYRETRTWSGDVLEKYSKLKKEGRSGDDVAVCGRVMTKRSFGKLAFCKMQDVKGFIQIVMQKGESPEDVEKLFKRVDSGDIIGVKGEVIKTKTGEVSILMKELVILTKAINPLPEKWHGLKDEEERLRKRYLDIIMNSDVKDIFFKKQRFWSTIRNFLIDRGFLEVETPILEVSAGGAAASPFATHHRALDLDVYLRISMGELWQKKALVAGFEKTFEIGRQFRNEGMDAEHLQDYTQMEFYWGYADFEDGMKLVEEMYKAAAMATLGRLDFKSGEYKVDLGSKWERYDFESLIKKKTGVDIYKETKEGIMKKLDKLKIEYDSDVDKWRLVDLLWKYCRKQISGPGFLTGQPVELNPLPKRDAKDRRKVQQFQVILAGSEMGNGYSELNDPIDQDERFKEQKKLGDAGDEEAHEHDESFVEALMYGMPPACGFGVSERLFSVLLDKPIRECVMFPLMKPEGVDEKTIKKKQKNDSKVILSNETKKLGLKTSYAIIEGVNVSKKTDGLEKEKKSLKVNNDEKKTDCMKEAFRSFGVNPKKRQPSCVALIERIKSGKGLYTVNSLVDSYNVGSIRECLPMAAYDLTKVDFPITLRKAKKDESITFIGGDKKKTKEGEIVYSDKNDVLCLDFNYRDCDKTKISEKTKSVIVFVDGCDGISDRDMLKALDNSCELIIKYNGGKVTKKELVK